MRTAFLLLLIAAVPAVAADSPWKRHTIDATSRGADGIRLHDANADGLPDLVTGWEQGGVTRLYLNPGPAKSKQPWPAVTVGKTPDVEDAVMVDLDRDGVVDVVSCMEGKTRKINVHWGPKQKDKFLDESAWTTDSFPQVAGRMWMFCVPMDIDGRNGVDLVVGGKANKRDAADSAVGWLESPADPRKLADWKFHPMTDAGWIMSIVPVDMDGDGHRDVLISDRYGPHRGVRWLKNPGNAAELTTPWKSHPVGPAAQVKFLDYADVDRDGKTDVVVGSERSITIHRRLDAAAHTWAFYEIAMPANTGGYKAVTIADGDLDGKNDLIITCEGASNGKHGVFRMSSPKWPASADWTFHPISGSDGVKHDLCPLVDLDGDGDLDVMTTEEVTKLGIVWYENPTK